MNPRMLLVPVLAVVAITLTNCGKSTSPTSGGGTPTGPSFNFTFPATGVSHALTFTDVGTWGYHCNAHQSLGMTGTVVVSASATADSATVNVGVNAANADAFVFTPSSVTIKTGGQVRWVNLSSMVIHTVTRP